MAQLEKLLTQMQPPSDERMRAEGYAVWLVWRDTLNPVVSQFIQEYGGLTLESDEEQSLLYFFSSNAFLAAARLESWSRFDATALTVVIMPATLTMGESRTFKLDMDPALQDQGLMTPDSFSIWVHPDVTQQAKAIPGVSLASKAYPSTLAELDWQNMVVDSRMPYQTNSGWYSILRPLGNPLDKDFQTGWRSLFDELEGILQRNKFRYTVHDFFLMFPMESLRQVRSWVRDFLETVQELRDTRPEAYWPCVIAVVNKKGLSFNNDLPHKVGLDWNLLSADHPHMSFQNALALGDNYTIHEVRFATGNGPEDWCNVSLMDAKRQGADAIPLLVPSAAAMGEHTVCFYCGQHGHSLTTCPTRIMPERDKDIWRRVAGFDFAMMRGGVRALDEVVKTSGNEGLLDMLSRDDAAGVMGRAVFDINHPFQLRSLERAWRARSKSSPFSTNDLLDAEHHPVLDILHAYPTATDKTVPEKELQALLSRYPRDFRIKNLLGFIALEKGDAQKAASLWKEAEVMAPAGFPQAWQIALQGRAMECSGRVTQAMVLYDQAIRGFPSWHLPEYRKIVCMVKTGFADSALTFLSTLLQQDANFFNMAIIDSEMERGHIQILSGLGVIWAGTEAQMTDEAMVLQRLHKEIGLWFTPDHPFAKQAEERIRKLKDLSKYHNYVPYMAAIQGRAAIERDMQQVISRESRELRNKFKYYLEKLSYIQREAAWFPFPRIMLEFNKNYNQCAASLNWALQSNLHTPEAFRRALIMATEEEKRLANLEKRLRFLRFIRDVTLFFLTLAKTFFWVELLALLLILVGFPLFVFYLQKSGSSLMLGSLADQQWQIQKAAIFITSFLSFTIALVRTVLRFEKIRDVLLEKARRAELARQQARRESAEEQLRQRRR